MSGAPGRPGWPGLHRVEVELPGPPFLVGVIRLVERAERGPLVAEHRRVELLLVRGPVGVLLAPGGRQDAVGLASSSRARTAGTWPVAGSVQWGSSAWAAVAAGSAVDRPVPTGSSMIRTERGPWGPG